jgi:hypothetical protein
MSLKIYSYPAILKSGESYAATEKDLWVISFFIYEPKDQASECLSQSQNTVISINNRQRDFRGVINIKVIFKYWGTVT